MMFHYGDQKSTGEALLNGNSDSKSLCRKNIQLAVNSFGHFHLGFTHQTLHKYPSRSCQKASSYLPYSLENCFNNVEE